MPDARRADTQRGGSDGRAYAFEKAVTKAAGGDGFADVWKKDFFGWEYKGKGKDLKAAYVQLLGYREDLANSLDTYAFCVDAPSHESDPHGARCCNASGA